MPNVRSGAQLRAYRESYNYRYEYFKRNPGLFGCIWFCSQCYKPLIGKKNVYVDHIIPLAKGGPNRVSNCTAICRKCNLDKSDKVDGRVIKGSVFKLFESGFSSAGRGVGGVLALGAGIGANVVNTTFKAGTGLIGSTFKLTGKVVGGAIKLVTFPLRRGTLVSRLFFLALYTAGVMYLLGNYTHVLDSWLASFG